MRNPELVNYPFIQQNKPEKNKIIQYKYVIHFLIKNYSNSLNMGFFCSSLNTF